MQQQEAEGLLPRVVTVNLKFGAKKLTAMDTSIFGGRSSDPYLQIYQDGVSVFWIIFFGPDFTRERDRERPSQKLH